MPSNVPSLGFAQNTNRGSNRAPIASAVATFGLAALHVDHGQFIPKEPMRTAIDEFADEHAPDFAFGNVYTFERRS